MNHGERENIERLRKIKDNTSELISKEIEILLEELRRKENTEKWDKILKTIRYHQFEQQQYLIWLQENTELRFVGLVLRTYDPNGRVVRYNPEQPN